MWGRFGNSPTTNRPDEPPLPDLRGAACGVLQGLQGGGLIHPRAPEQVDGGGTDLADEDADPELVAILQDLGGGPGGFERPTACLFGPPAILQKRGQGPYGAREVEYGLGQLRGYSVSSSDGVDNATGQDAGIYYGQLYPYSGAAVELELPQGPSSGGGEPGRLVAGFERLVHGSDPAVYLPGPFQNPFGPFFASAFEHGGDL